MQPLPLTHFTTLSHTALPCSLAELAPKPTLAVKSDSPNHWLRTVKLVMFAAHAPASRKQLPIPRDAFNAWAVVDDVAGVSTARSVRKNLCSEFTTEWRERERFQQQRRLQALKENNADEYLRHVTSLKLASLLSIMEATHKFMLAIGAHMGSAVGTSAGSSVDPMSLANDTDRFKAFINATKTEYQLVHKVEVSVTAQPQSVLATLMPHQMVGLHFLASLHANHINGILADEMGVGKTLQTLAFLCRLKELNQARGPHLILAPLSIVREWQESAATFIPSLNVKHFDDVDLMNLRHSDVVLFPLHRVGKYAADLKRVRWDFIVVDEAHKAVSNPATITAQAIVSLPFYSRLVLTGTPLNNDVQELWALLNFLNPKMFGSQETFEEVFRRPFAGCGQEASLNDEERQVLVLRMHQILRPFMLRRTKQDIDTSLSITFHELRCPLSWLQQHLLANLRDRGVLPAVLSGGSFGNRHVTTKESIAQNICNHPFNVPFFEQAIAGTAKDQQVAGPDGVAVDDEGAALNTLLAGESMARLSGKYAILDTLLLRLRLVDRKVVVFSHFLDTIDLLENHLNEIGFQGQYVTLTGTTHVDERKEYVRLFRSDPNVRIFILSVKAGGCGLNLQVADVVVLIDRDYTTTNEDQAIARVFRMGQKNTVRAMYLTTADPCEQRVMEIADRKNRPRLAIIEAGDFQSNAHDADDADDDGQITNLQKHLTTNCQLIDLTSVEQHEEDYLAVIHDVIDPLLCAGDTDLLALLRVDRTTRCAAVIREPVDLPREISGALDAVRLAELQEEENSGAGKGFRKREEDVWFGEPSDAFVAKWAEEGLDEFEIDAKWKQQQLAKLKKKEAALAAACDVSFERQSTLCEVNINASNKNFKTLLSKGTLPAVATTHLEFDLMTEVGPLVA